MDDEKKQILTKEQALQKLRYYCAYQERCHQEVKEKLYSFGLHKKEVEEAVCELIGENYLNEERFAIQFAGGKYRVKRWGRAKIKQALRLRQVSEYCINKALKEIPEDQYSNTLEAVAAAKWKTLGGVTNPLLKKRRLQNYLIQKGFEPDLVYETLKQLTGK